MEDWLDITRDRPAGDRIDSVPIQGGKKTCCTFHCVSTAASANSAAGDLSVPVERDDESYFEALLGLNKSMITEIYLGLVHDSDGVSGTNQRIKAASRFLPEFGVATECGMGRCDPERIPGLLQIHADVANPVI